MERRTFLKKSTFMATSAALLQPSETEINFHIPADFSLKILATNWGFKGTTEDFAKKAKDEGYDGAEMWLPSEKKEQDSMLNAFLKNGLQFGFLVGGSQKEFIPHIESFEKAVDAALPFKPLYLNSHPGRDYFTPEQAKAFFDLTVKKSQQSGLPIYHETHRGRLCFAAHITKQYLEKSPDLRLTLDISHWCNVHESLLDDQPEAVDLALSRTEHIHARVGHPEGPQVNDPRAPEWDRAVKKHLAWWDKVIENKVKNGKSATILTEFGPPDYLPALPYTRQPVADQWAINAYMMKMLRERYKAK
jgi:sugar phosphate isomerase/epimerase